jgi:hypothetical protein
LQVLQKLPVPIVSPTAPKPLPPKTLAPQRRLAQTGVFSDHPRFFAEAQLSAKTTTHQASNIASSPIFVSKAPTYGLLRGTKTIFRPVTRKVRSP